MEAYNFLHFYIYKDLLTYTAIFSLFLLSAVQGFALSLYRVVDYKYIGLINLPALQLLKLTFFKFKDCERYKIKDKISVTLCLIITILAMASMPILLKASNSKFVRSNTYCKDKSALSQYPTLGYCNIVNGSVCNSQTDYESIISVWGKSMSTDEREVELSPREVPTELTNYEVKTLFMDSNQIFSEVQMTPTTTNIETASNASFKFSYYEAQDGSTVEKLYTSQGFHNLLGSTTASFNYEKEGKPFKEEYKLFEIIFGNNPAYFCSIDEAITFEAINVVAATNNKINTIFQIAYGMVVEPNKNDINDEYEYNLYDNAKTNVMPGKTYDIFSSRVINNVLNVRIYTNKYRNNNTMLYIKLRLDNVVSQTTESPIQWFKFINLLETSSGGSPSSRMQLYNNERLFNLFKTENRINLDMAQYLFTNQTGDITVDVKRYKKTRVQANKGVIIACYLLVLATIIGNILRALLPPFVTNSIAENIYRTSLTDEEELCASRDKKWYRRLLWPELYACDIKGLYSNDEENHITVAFSHRMRQGEVMSLIDLVLKTKTAKSENLRAFSINKFKNILRSSDS